MYCDHPCHTWGLIVPHVSISLHIMVQSSLLGSITPLVTVPAVGLHGVIDLFWETTPAEVADRCIFWCRFLPNYTYLYKCVFWEAALSHKDFTQLDLRPLINMTGSTNSKESEVHHHSAFPNNHVYITISISFWIDWVMILLHWNT
jgi:hypothetical protein